MPTVSHPFAPAPRRARLRAGLSGLLALLVLAVAAPPAAAQPAYINQDEVADILNHRAESLDDLPEVFYTYMVLSDSRDNTARARNTLYKRLGNGDGDVGRHRARYVEMINRRLMENVEVGDTLVVPEVFDLDFRAYSPFPRYYPGARDLEKLFVIDKHIQAWAAYEHGQLNRWGVVNTGEKDESPTPNGRFNFNWKTEYRVSSLSPPGEPWEMYWVFNFHDARGIHVHQYAFPTGGPMSHGCVRLLEADAKWIYDWADTWKTTKGNGFGSSAGRILEQGTPVIVIGDEPEGKPSPFEFKKRYPVLKKVELPASPWDVPAGTPQQEHFDRLRTASR